MIIQNGYIENVYITDGGIDQATGHNVAGTVSYGCRVPCQYYLKSYREAVLANGEKVDVEAYMILVEEPYERAGADQVRLSDLNGKILDVYMIETVEPLEAVSEIKITVKPMRHGLQEHF